MEKISPRKDSQQQQKKVGYFINKSGFLTLPKKKNFK